MIEFLSKNDAAAIARIHKENLPGILSIYPVSVLKEFYELQLSNASKNFALGFFENRKLQGFVFGTYRVDEIFNDYIKSAFYYYLFQTFVSFLKNPKLLVYYLKAFFSKKRSSFCPVQLVYIAVDQNSKKKGIGQQLLDAFENELSRNNINYFELEVEQNNPALRFYRKNNFETILEINNWMEEKFLLGKEL